MTKTSRTKKTHAMMTVTQAIMAGMILLVTLLITAVLALIRIQSASVAEMVSGLLAPSQAPWLGGVLWLLEIAGYFYIAWALSRRNWFVGGAGVAAGLLVRLLLGMLMAFVIQSRMGMDFSGALVAVNGTLWLFRLLGMVATAVLLAFPCRGVLAAWFGVQALLTDKPVTSSNSFSFNTVRATGSARHTPVVKRETAAPALVLAPPDNFIARPPVEDVYGLVSVPVKLICESVPEAVDYLRPQLPVRIPLGYFVPQLSQATVWLTWQQVFPSTPEDPNRAHIADRPDAQFHDRWIRIPARYYVSQVPQEYFAKGKPAPVRWLMRAPVPQEETFMQTATARGGR